MQVAIIDYPITTLGPGERYCLWTVGCPRRCPGCISPELQEPNEKFEMPIEEIVDDIKKVQLEHPDIRITISGGDPFEQPDLLSLLKEIEKLGILDILIYTGYTYEELSKKFQNFDEYASRISVLIDGPYVKEEDDGLALRGSANQNIYIFKREFAEEYREFLQRQRQVQYIEKNGIFFTIGIPLNKRKE